MLCRNYAADMTTIREAGMEICSDLDMDMDIDLEMEGLDIEEEFEELD
jgi:hypothetical protein